MDMDTTKNSSLPRWMTCIAVPTFAMPTLLLGYLGWGCSRLFANAWEQPPPPWLLWGVVAPMLALVLLLWPVYIIWAWKSQQLSRGEKIRWIVMILWLTMFGMIAFYLFMVRRHTGKERQIRPQDEVRVAQFLTKNGLDQATLSQEQYYILVKYTRSTYQNQWILVPIAFLAIVMLYFVLIIVPELGVSVFTEWLPMEHRVIVHETGEMIRQETAPEQEVISLFIEQMLMMGMLSGMFGMMIVMFVGQSISQLFTVKKKFFIEFLQATETTAKSSAKATRI